MERSARWNSYYRRDNFDEYPVKMSSCSCVLLEQHGHFSNIKRLCEYFIAGLKRTLPIPDNNELLIENTFLSGFRNGQTRSPTYVYSRKERGPPPPPPAIYRAASKYHQEARNLQSLPL